MLKRGVPSVMLFLVKINGISSKLGSGVNSSLFPDDLAIYTTIARFAFGAGAFQDTNMFNE